MLRCAISDEEALKIARAEGKQRVAQSGTTPRGAPRAERRDEAGFALLRPRRVRAVLRAARTHVDPTRSRSPIPDPRRHPDEDPLLRHRPDRARHQGRIGARRGRGGGTGGARARGDGARDAGTRRAAALARALGRDAAAVRIAAPAAWRASGAIATLARGIRPDAIVERYHNFGGEAIRLARRLGRGGGARGERAGHRSPRIVEGAARSRAARRADAAVARTAVRAAPTSS